MSRAYLLLVMFRISDTGRQSLVLAVVRFALPDVIFDWDTDFCSLDSGCMAALEVERFLAEEEEGVAE